MVDPSTSGSWHICAIFCIIYRILIHHIKVLHSILGRRLWYFICTVCLSHNLLNNYKKIGRYIYYKTNARHMIKKGMKGTLSCHHTCWVHKDGLHLSRKNKGSVFSCLTFSSKLQPTNTLNFFVFVVGTRYYTIWKKQWVSFKKISKIKEHDSLNYNKITANN